VQTQPSPPEGPSAPADVLIVTTLREERDAGFDEGHGGACGHGDAPDGARATRRSRTALSRSRAASSCDGRSIFRPGSASAGRETVGTTLAPRGTGGSRGLAAGIRRYAAAAYLRRSADRLRKVAAYPREYADMSPGGAGHRQETEIGWRSSRPTCRNAEIGYVSQMIATLDGRDGSSVLQ
jgi:hypothetical protein